MRATDVAVLADALEGGIVIERMTSTARSKATGRQLSKAAVKRAIGNGWLDRTHARSLDFHYRITETGLGELAPITDGDLGDAMVIAINAHAGQVDKAGEAYILHPAAVYWIVSERFPYDTHVGVVAWLHDVVEDTSTTLDEIRDGFGLEIAKAVDAITHRPGEPRDDYYRRLATNRAALRVKRADIAHNSDPRRIEALDPATRGRLTAKYAHATKMLDVLEGGGA